jgi:hypothetical protein
MTIVDCSSRLYPGKWLPVTGTRARQQHQLGCVSENLIARCGAILVNYPPNDPRVPWKSWPFCHKCEALDWRARAPLGLRVDDDEDFAHAVLPELATCGERLTAILRTLMDTLTEAELIERTLRTAEPHSPVATTARSALRTALAGLEYPVFHGLEEAKSAFCAKNALPVDNL